MGCLLCVRDDLLPQEFNHLRVLFMSERRREREIDTWTGAAAALIWMLRYSVVVERKRELKITCAPKIAEGFIRLSTVITLNTTAITCHPGQKYILFPGDWWNQGSLNNLRDCMISLTSH